MSQPHIDAMKQTLDALNHKKWFRIGSGKPNDPKVEPAITALNAALNQAIRIARLIDIKLKENI
jgi:hypothetical protein